MKPFNIFDTDPPCAECSLRAERLYRRWRNRNVNWTGNLLQMCQRVADRVCRRVRKP